MQVRGTRGESAIRGTVNRGPDEDGQGATTDGPALLQSFACQLVLSASENLLVVAK